MALDPLTLTDDELVAITGLRRPSAQLDELRRQGFHRARRSPATGRVILERAHYQAVASGVTAPTAVPAPQLRPAPALR